jgi:hypothetical protein
MGEPKPGDAGEFCHRGERRFSRPGFSWRTQEIMKIIVFQ